LILLENSVGNFFRGFDNYRDEPFNPHGANRVRIWDHPSKYYRHNTLAVDFIMDPKPLLRQRCGGASGENSSIFPCF
jgi:hypothetical protein